MSGARVVSVTPTAVERDSRTFKHAATLARHGYDSIVVEAIPSVSLPERLPFRLLVAGDSERSAASAVPPQSAPVPAAAGEPPAPPEQLDVGALVRIRRSLPAPLRAPARAARAGFNTVRSRLLGLRYRMALPFRFLREYRRTNARTLEALPPAELYWLHSYWQYPAVARIRRSTGGEFIYDAHDFYRDTPVAVPIVNRVLQRIERRCARNASALSTVSPSLAARMSRIFGREFAVIRNAHDLRLDERAGVDLRCSIGVEPGDFLVVVVGNRKPELAVEEALSALSRLDRGVHLAFVGGGFEDDRELVSIHGLEGRVHFMPAVIPTQLASYIRTADVAAVLYKPLTENDLNALPNRLFHSIAAGVPLLYPPLPEVKALAEKFDLGLEADSTDPEAIAAAIRRMRENPKLLDRHRAAAQAARRELNWEHEEGTVLELARSALAGDRA